MESVLGAIVTNTLLNTAAAKLSGTYSVWPHKYSADSFHPDTFAWLLTPALREICWTNDTECVIDSLAMHLWWRTFGGSVVSIAGCCSNVTRALGCRLRFGVPVMDLMYAIGRMERGLMLSGLGSEVSWIREFRYFFCFAWKCFFCEEKCFCSELVLSKFLFYSESRISRKISTFLCISSWKLTWWRTSHWLGIFCDRGPLRDADNNRWWPWCWFCSACVICLFMTFAFCPFDWRRGSYAFGFNDNCRCNFGWARLISRFSLWFDWFEPFVWWV